MSQRQGKKARPEGRHTQPGLFVIWTSVSCSFPCVHKHTHRVKHPHVCTVMSSGNSAVLYLKLCWVQKQ